MRGGNMDESKRDVTKAKDENTITHLERNGKSFLIIEHFSEGQTYTDIVKNALRREFESD
jgi:hypothetical protein